ncbi:MAG: site-specific integrase [Pseudomonadota bacterium]|nr:site-specific integrase [Pseudomonadota bacterium]QKK06346.1 MAG: site-specific integrase [Pseudomonadota bacterium]
MSFIIDKEELKPGLIVFRRGDVVHKNWYCRIKLPKADRYKTVSLKTSDIHEARERAYDHYADVRFRLKHDVPIFDKSFYDVAVEYTEVQRHRAQMGEITHERVKKIASVINAQLNPYAGSTQISLIGQERWSGYPAWRREHGEGRLREQVSDATIKFEMSIFGAIMNYAVRKRYIPASHKFEGRPNFKTMRRDAFSLEEYRALHSRGRSWVKSAPKPQSLWYRTIAYNFVLIMCNTGMRPPEARNLRWRDISRGKDKDGRELLILSVTGKDKMRQLVAPVSVGDYLERIRNISKATEPDDPVFTTIDGKPVSTLYKALIRDLLITAKLRDGPSGIPRSTYSFRHTYATFRLSEGVDVYFLAQQMGTSVKMIEEHYGHVNAVKHADRVLHGMGSWEVVPSDPSKPENSRSGKSGTARSRPSRLRGKRKNKE